MFVLELGVKRELVVVGLDECDVCVLRLCRYDRVCVVGMCVRYLWGLIYVGVGVGLHGFKRKSTCGSVMWDSV